jgi:HlyD family secretion protein
METHAETHTSSMLNRRLLLILAAIISVTAGAAAYYKVTTPDAAPKFVTTAVTRGNIVDSVEATGTLEAVNTVQVGTQVSGTIKSLSADFNSRVRKGQVVAELEPSLFQTQVDQAQATVSRLQAEVERARVQADDAHAKLTRAQELSDRQLISRNDLETAETTANQADAAVKSAEAQVVQARASLNQNQVTLDHTIIRAPIDGVVISRNVDVGQTVAASMSAPTLFVIANDLSRMQVNASIDESDIGRVAPGQAVTFKVDAYPNQTFTGTVSQVRLQPVTEQNVVSYVTVIDVPNPDLKLKPGMTATVTVEIARADNVLHVPSAALRFRPSRGEPRVWVLGSDGQVQPVRVQPGLSDGTSVAVIGDLEEGAQVVTGEAAAAVSASAQAGTSPLMPFGGRRMGGGGNAGAQGSGAGRRPQGTGR